MHVRVDQAGQDVQAARVKSPVRGGVRADTQRDDFAVAHADVRVLRAPCQHAGAVAKHKVVMRRHRWSLSRFGEILSLSGVTGHPVTTAASFAPLQIPADIVRLDPRPAPV